MLFVNLPPELLQLIFLCSSTPSFVQLIRTCHTLFDLAAQSRGIVEHHLTDLPGGEAVGSLSTASTKELFLILRRRAAASLQGVNITADRQDFYFLDSVVDANASCVTSSDHHNIALVRKGWPSVQIYQVFEGVLKYRRVLDLSSGDREKYKLQQTVFDEANNVFILYGTEDTNQMPARPDHPRGKPSTRHSSGEARLVRVGLSDLFPTKDSWYVHGVIHLEPNKCAEPIRPINMAAWSGNKVSIVWDSGSSIGQVKYAFIGVYKLLPDRESKSLYIDHVPPRQPKQFDTLPENSMYAIRRVAFSHNGTCMRYYSPGMATPTFRTDRLVDNNANDAWINDMMFPLPIGTEERISVEDAFFYYHDTMKLEDNPPQLFCRNVRLYFATVTFPSLNQTIACIVKESRDTLNDSCSHGLGPDEIQAVLIDPIIVARLCFFQLLVTSMATVMTFARQGTRIAVASWDKIFVWPFLPEILAEIRDDCQTYRKTYDRNLQCNLVELKPIILKAEAVVHKMAFGASGNELITITDKGLQIWNLGPSATGLRRVNRLPEDEQDENGDSSYLKSPQAPKITRRCLRAPAEDRRDVRPC